MIVRTLFAYRGGNNMELDMIDKDKIRPATWQPREDFPKDKIDELTQSIKGVGLIQPIVVRKKGNSYQIIAGERRWRAYEQSDFDKIPCVVRKDDDIDSKVISLVENWQRSPVDIVQNEKFIYELWEEGKQSKKWVSIKEMEEKTGIHDTTLGAIIHGYEERLSFQDNLKGEEKLTYDDFHRSRPLEKYPETRKRILEDRADRKISSQSELHKISKKLAEFPEEEQQLEILDEIEKHQAFSKDALDTIVEEKKRIVDGEREPEWQPPKEENRWFLDDMARQYDKIYGYGVGNLNGLPKKQRDEAVDVLANALIYLMGQLVEMGEIDRVRNIYEKKVRV